MNASSAEVTTMNHPVVSRERWLAERKTLLAQEKELTRLRDQIAGERRALPWVRIEKNYVFDTPEGPRPLAGLFEGRRQLIVQHFMLGPDWEQGCPSCSFMADHIDSIKDYGFDLGGPVIKDKLWFYVTYGKQDIKLCRLNGTKDATLLPSYNAKLNWQAESYKLSGKKVMWSG